MSTVTVDAAPAPEAVLARVLHTHRRRFKPVPEGGEPVATGEPKREAAALMTLPRPLVEWLARAGRFAAVASATNTLGVGDDAQAAALFLRDRASRSPPLRFVLVLMLKHHPHRPLPHLI